MAFVRFVVLHKGEDSTKRQGLFQAIADLDGLGALQSHEQSVRDDIKNWFSSNLERPRKFSRSSRLMQKMLLLVGLKIQR